MQVSVKMKPITVFLVLAISGLAYSAPTGSDVVAQILKAIQGNQDLTRVADYMEDFGDGFRKILPAVGPGRYCISFKKKSFVILNRISNN